MNVIRNSYGKFSRYLCFLFALHLFSLSIDINDRVPASELVFLPLNNIGDVAKFFTDVFLSIDDACTDSDLENVNLFNELCRDFCLSEEIQIVSCYGEFLDLKYSIANVPKHSVWSQTVNVPPPWC